MVGGNSLLFRFRSLVIFVFLIIFLLISSASVLSDRDDFYRRHDSIELNNRVQHVQRDEFSYTSRNYNTESLYIDSYSFSDGRNHQHFSENRFEVKSAYPISSKYAQTAYGIHQPIGRDDYVRQGYGSDNGMVIYSKSDLVRKDYGSGIPSSGLSGNFVRRGDISEIPGSGLRGNYLKVGDDYIDSFLESTSAAKRRHASQANSYRTYTTPAAGSVSSSAGYNYQYYVRSYKINQQSYAFQNN